MVELPHCFMMEMKGFSASSWSEKLSGVSLARASSFPTSCRSESTEYMETDIEVRQAARSETGHS